VVRLREDRQSADARVHAPGPRVPDLLGPGAVDAATLEEAPGGDPRQDAEALACFQRTILHALAFALRSGAQEARFADPASSRSKALQFDLRVGGRLTRFVFAELDVTGLDLAELHADNAPSHATGTGRAKAPWPAPLSLQSAINSFAARLSPAGASPAPEGIVIALVGCPPLAPAALRGALVCGTHRLAQRFPRIYVSLADIDYLVWEKGIRVLDSSSFESAEEINKARELRRRRRRAAATREPRRPAR
jgi:hypothetical protein